jgi:hypothetical protein
MQVSDRKNTRDPSFQTATPCTKTLVCTGFEKKWPLRAILGSSRISEPKFIADSSLGVAIACEGPGGAPPEVKEYKLY